MKRPHTHTHTHTNTHTHTHTHTHGHTRKHTHTLKYYAAINENEILPSATSWMYLHGMRVSEISQRKTNPI